MRRVGLFGRTVNSGITHDSLIFQSSNFHRNIADGTVIPQSEYSEGGVAIHPLILGDSATLSIDYETIYKFNI